MNNIEYRTLNNGVQIPCMGTGPGSVMRGKQVSFWGKSSAGKFMNRVCQSILFCYKSRKYVNSLTRCIRLGYRLIDYSTSYGSEELITKAILKSGVKREDVFVTTRVSNPQQVAGKTREALLTSLKKMNLEYIDLYMFHWPVTGYFIKTYKEIEKLYKEGYVKAIGVCNCNQHHLEDILEKCEIVPAVNQFEVHPLFTQKPLIEFCQSHGITVEAYTPLARNDDRLVRNKILRNLGEKYQKSNAQIILRWEVQQGLIPIPRSSNPERQASNIDIFDFTLTDDEMRAIDSININSRLRYDPDNCDFSIL